jgi:exodeoxyribonuclease III
MRIATFNINSIKAHFQQLAEWLKAEKPDVVCLQEIKCEDHAFPTAALEELGYASAVHGQKTYNGVAILSRHKIEDIVKGLPGDPADEQARFICATIINGAEAVRVAGIYLPNGNPAPGPKYDYKLAWMVRLKTFVAAELKKEEPLVIAGDYNVIPYSIDAKNPQNWTTDALHLPQTRASFQSLLALGLTESFRTLHPAEPGHFSFWDYQAGAWPKNNGIRIDHLLLSPQAADKLQSSRIHRDMRGHEKPSDHVAVEITLRS